MPDFSLKDALDAYRPADEADKETKRRMLELLHDHPEEGFKREWMVPGHFTASCWLVNGDTALLTHHAFLDRWLQLGGHADGHPDLLAAALREAREESGLTDIQPVMPEIFDLDIHDIPANPRKNEGPHLHYDVRFLLQTPETDVHVSDESQDLRWFTASEIAAMPVDEAVQRLNRKWQNGTAAL